MSITIILNFARSGGTLLTRVLGMLDDTIVVSEVNPWLGATPDNVIVKSEIALKQQMKQWYNINLKGETFVDLIFELQQYCINNGKKLVLRDWTYLDFRKSAYNSFKPSYKFTILKVIENKINTTKFAFVRDAIDVYLSTGGELKSFAEDYLKFANEIVKQQIKIFKYEDFVSNPEQTIKDICEYTGIKFSERYERFYDNLKCTGDIQVGKFSRGFKMKTIKPLKRKRVSKKLAHEIDSNEELMQSNIILKYPAKYHNGNVESLFEVLIKKINFQIRKRLN